MSAILAFIKKLMGSIIHIEIHNYKVENSGDVRIGDSGESK